MLDKLIFLYIGLAVGGFIGFFVCAVLTAGKEVDNDELED